MNRMEKRRHLTATLHSTSEDILKYLLRRLSADDAADAFGDVMVAAWKRADSLPDDAEEARMWMFGIARNTLMHAKRGNTRRSRLADRLREETSLRIAPPADEGIEVRNAIEQLEDDLSELVRLVHWEGFSLTQAATLLQLPASTVRSRYQRAKQELRDALLVK